MYPHQLYSLPFASYGRQGCHAAHTWRPYVTLATLDQSPVSWHLQHSPGQLHIMHSFHADHASAT